ncbi:MAG TPA: DUF3606 domain-containing protein [Pirellulaceae bacterium]|nr:DUF3606 domain-containing protein [Pirellulaceae bacterium]
MTGRKASGVNVNDRRELAFWSRRFGVTDAQLRRAVRQVGTEVAALAKYLGKAGASPAAVAQDPID